MLATRIHKYTRLHIQITSAYLSTNCIISVWVLLLWTTILLTLVRLVVIGVAWCVTGWWTESRFDYEREEQNELTHAFSQLWVIAFILFLFVCEI